MIDNYNFLESIKNLSLEEQNARLKNQLEFNEQEHQQEILFLNSQISKFSALYYECQNKLYQYET